MTVTWPSIRTIKHGLAGILPVSKTEDGDRFKGHVAGGTPWVIWNGEAVACTRCRVMVPNPPPVDLDPEKAAKATGPMVMAQHTLAVLLHPFAKEHAACGAQPHLEIQL